MRALGRLARLILPARGMAALASSSDSALLASPRTTDPLFRRIEEVHAARGARYGHILDAGTGGHSLKWLARLPAGGVASVTAVTADASAGEGKGAADLRHLLDAARGDALAEGKWCVPGAAPPLAVEKFDTVLVDYLVGSMDGFTPFAQDVFFDELAAYCAPSALVHVVGLGPIYTSLGGGYGSLSPAEKVVVDVARARDACILLAGHRPYREFPADWIIRHLKKSGFRLVGDGTWKSYGVVWKHATAKKQIDVARRKLPLFDDRDVAKAMAAKLDALDAAAAALLGEKGVVYGHDYVISAERAAAPES